MPAKLPRPKHIPRRTCVACRRTDAKRGLVRVVRTPSGAVEVDPTGKKSGRGAYLCATRDCWAQGLKRHLLEHALKLTIEPADRAVLAAFGESLPAELAEVEEQKSSSPGA